MHRNADQTLRRPATGPQRVLQAATVVAVGAAALGLVSGAAAYLYVRFTQQREHPPRGGERSPANP